MVCILTGDISNKRLRNIINIFKRKFGLHPQQTTLGEKKSIFSIHCSNHTLQSMFSRKMLKSLVAITECILILIITSKLRVSCFMASIKEVGTFIAI